MRVIYRISDAGYNKIKPDYITNENCLKNFFVMLPQFIMLPPPFFNLTPI